MNDDLQNAITLVKSGQKKQGGQILADMVKQQPNNETAWLWLVQCVNTDQQKIFCLNKVLEINPQHEGARKFLQKLQSNQAPQFQFADDLPHISDMLVQDNRPLPLEHQSNIDHLLTLALAAEEAKNHEEAYKYYSQVLEQDAGVSIAWIGKGISAGWLSSAERQRMDEALTCITRGLDSNHRDAKWIKHAAFSLIHITESYTIAICKYLEDKYDAEVSPRSSGKPRRLAGEAERAYCRRCVLYNNPKVHAPLSPWGRGWGWGPVRPA
jgi:tetratricopeptide (TPR) repeat protein